MSNKIKFDKIIKSHKIIKILIILSTIIILSNTCSAMEIAEENQKNELENTNLNLENLNENTSIQESDILKNSEIKNNPKIEEISQYKETIAIEPEKISQYKETIAIEPEIIIKNPEETKINTENISSKNIIIKTSVKTPQYAQITTNGGDLISYQKNQSIPGIKQTVELYSDSLKTEKVASLNTYKISNFLGTIKFNLSNLINNEGKQFKFNPNEIYYLFIKSYKQGQLDPKYSTAKNYFNETSSKTIKIVYIPNEKIEINPINSIKYGDNLTISGNLKENSKRLANKEIIIEILNKNTTIEKIKTITDSEGNFKINNKNLNNTLNANNYTIKISYSNDSISTKEIAKELINLTINKKDIILEIANLNNTNPFKDTIIQINNSLNNKEDGSYIWKLYNLNNELIKEGNELIIKNNKTDNHTINLGKLAIGEYKIVVEFRTNDENNYNTVINNSLISSKKIGTKLIANNFITNPLSNASYTIELKDLENNSIGNKNIKFILKNKFNNTKTYSRTGNNEGKGTLEIYLIAGTYEINVVFEGDEMYGATNKTINLTVA